MTREELERALSDKIKARMRELRMRHKELAIIMHVKPSSLSKMINGRTSITAYNIHKIEQALRITILNLNND